MGCQIVGGVVVSRFREEHLAVVLAVSEQPTEIEGEVLPAIGPGESQLRAGRRVWIDPLRVHPLR